jgi:hypothetical protein
MSRSVLAIALLGAASCFSLNAQIGVATMFADIPFEFRMGSSVMPAGRYTIAQGPGVLKFATVDHSKAAIVLVQATSRMSKGSPALLFNRYGDEHVLSTVWSTDLRSGQRLPVSRYEKELVSRAGGVQTASIPLKRQ